MAGGGGHGTGAWALGVGRAWADICPGHFLAARLREPASAKEASFSGGMGRTHEMMPVELLSQ